MSRTTHRQGALLVALIGILTTTVATAGAAPAAQPQIEAESMALPVGLGQPFGDAAASGRAGLLIWSNGTAEGSLTAAAAAGTLVVRARGDQCNGAPMMAVTVDGTSVGTVPVISKTWTDYPFVGSWAIGAHRVQLGFSNDATGPGCDRNLRLDRVQFRPSPPATPTPLPTPAPTPTPTPATPTPLPTPTPTPTPTSPTPTPTSSPSPSPSPTPPPTAAPDGNPFTGAHPYADPSSSARRAADGRRSVDPVGAAALDKIAQSSAADWYGDWNPADALAATVAARVTVVTASGALPVLVAYDIPHRDCGSYSAGGAADATAYRRWIGQLALGIGTRKAVVVLEPDALPQMDCLNSADQQERTGLLSAAVDTLAALPATSVYLDSGGATWQPASTMAPRLLAAGADRARGFSLNVSGFTSTDPTLAYGREVSRLLGGKHFILDSSRNGLGDGDTWCNPAGRALGMRMTTATAEPLADAFTWIKAPGESDGSCGGGPAAGQFWVDYAIGLALRASY